MNRCHILLFYLLINFFFIACKKEKTNLPVSTPFNQKYNVLWLVAEDMSPNIPPFGDSTIQTPHLSRLAAEGVCYTNVYSVSGVCAPSRAALCTGMYPSSIGAHHMRTTTQTANAKKYLGLIDYEVVPPPEVKMVSEIIRANNYYCSNNSKTDYQFKPSKMAWDESSIYAHWRNRPAGKLFYSIFNFNVTHESNMWNPRYGHFDNDAFPPPRHKKTAWQQFENGEKPWSVPEGLNLNIPPYLPVTDLVKKDLRRMYSNIAEMDQHVGMIIGQLEEDGLLENTIIVWYTDHGGPLPRQKRLLYDSGIKVPMIIRYPNQWQAGTTDDQLISFVDFAPTLLSMCHIEPPAHMQGRAFAGKYQSKNQRKYIHAAADRFDESYDMKRAVRDKQFKYLKNFQPEIGYYLPLAYRKKMATMHELLRMRKEGTLNKIQMQWFRSSKPEEELFDVKNDPHELNNLAGNPAYAEKLKELKNECEHWMQKTNDKGLIPEEDLIQQFWPNKIQPITAAPEIKKENNQLFISCKTEGASIGYKYPEDELPESGWHIYKKPIELTAGKQIKIIAHRIGYAPSDTLVWKN
ncbi:MAG: sulfatase-like hydrolase/transferase [Bacteroidota bacterium]